MQWLRAMMLWGLLWPVSGAAQTETMCALNCRASVPRGADLAYEACVALVCTQNGPSGPAWQAGRMDAPDHGGYAAVSSDDFAQQMILTCESRGPLSLVLRSGTIDRGLVQLIVDGQSVEWLDLDQRNGVLVSEIPRASRLVMALQDGGRVRVLSEDGRAEVSFGLRGSDRAITEAMGYCAER